MTMYQLPQGVKWTVKLQLMPASGLCDDMSYRAGRQCTQQCTHNVTLSAYSRSWTRQLAVPRNQLDDWNMRTAV